MHTVRVTVDWHVHADGRWMIEPVPVGSTPPVNVYVTEDRMAPVLYRHQAGECRRECTLPCGHALTYGCDCDTIAAEADAGMPDLQVQEAGRTYVIGVGLRGLIRAQREHAGVFRRGGNAPAYVRVLTDLRDRVATELGVDRRTASRILRSIKASDLA